MLVGTATANWSFHVATDPLLAQPEPFPVSKIQLRSNEISWFRMVGTRGYQAALSNKLLRNGPTGCLRGPINASDGGDWWLNDGSQAVNGQSKTMILHNLIDFWDSDWLTILWGRPPSVATGDAVCSATCQEWRGWRSGNDDTPSILRPVAESEIFVGPICKGWAVEHLSLNIPTKKSKKWLIRSYPVQRYSTHPLIMHPTHLSVCGNLTRLVRVQRGGHRLYIDQ